MLDPPTERIIGVSEFRAKCLGLMRDVHGEQLSRVVITKWRKPIAIMTKSATDYVEIFPI